MKISVTKDRLNIIKREDLHAGEYNINKCEFEFSEEYTKDLVKTALFVAKDKVYSMLILDNKCDIPKKVLSKADYNVFLGIYAYKLIDNELDLRYSPSPVSFSVYRGSYRSDDEELDEEKATKVEQALQEMTNTLNLANEKITTVSDLIEELTNTSESLEEAQEIARQVKIQLENGELNGPKGDSGESAYEIWLNLGNTGTEQDFLDSLKGDKGAPGIQGIQGEIGPQGLKGEKGIDGYTPVYGQDYMGPEDKKAIQDYCKNYIDEKYLSLLEEEY